MVHDKIYLIKGITLRPLNSSSFNFTPKCKICFPPEKIVDVKNNLRFNTKMKFTLVYCAQDKVF